MSEPLRNLIDSFHERYADIAPIMVTAPTQRCGSTLLQRAINAGEEAVIYGENFFLVEKMPTILSQPLRGYESKVELTDNTSKAFFDGNTGMDATALFPPFVQYCETLLDQYYALMKFYAEEAKKKGRDRWGLKHQLVQFQNFHNFMVLVPNPKSIVVYRSVLDVAKSHKGRWPDQLTSLEQLTAYGKRWADNLEYLTREGPNKLLVKYEDLIEDKEGHIKKLEEFLEVKLSRDVFDRKVNAHFVNDEVDKMNSKEEGSYVPPAELDYKEEQAILTFSRPAMQKFGYDV